MPRQGRQLSENKIYHVMIRGNERKNIFHEKIARRKICGEILLAH
jgi:REP element-mobilizing transposase RayT